MSWLRRIFGGGAGGDDEDTTPVLHLTGQGDVPLGKAKPELFRLLRERGARAALIRYEGGQDEGGVTSISVGSEPLGGDPETWTGTSLPGADDVKLEWEGKSDDARLLEAAEWVVCDKWGSFAGEFEVEGLLVVDVDGERIARHDSWRVFDEDVDDAAVREVQAV